MRAPTDLPRRRTRRPRGRAGLLVLAAVLSFLLVSVRGAARFYTDFLWFDELDLTDVWKGVLGAKVVLGLLFTAVFFAVMWVNLAIADRIAPGFRPAGPEEELVERYHDVVGAHTGLVRTAIAGLFALIAGPGAASQWNAWVLFRNGVPFGSRDALFQRDIGFFVFQLPFLSYLVDWAFAATMIVLIVTAVAHYLNGGIRLQTPFQKVTPQVKAHLSLLLGALALLKALGYFLQQYELVYSTRGVVHGAGYTDVRAQLPALRLLIIIALAAFVLFVVNILRRGWVLPVIAVGLWAFVSVVVGAAVPAVVQRITVEPAESEKERPYIERNIRATRAAMNLEGTTVTPFPFTGTLTSAELADNAETIRNVRLWDPSVLQDTYQRLQEIRTFFRFNDVDVDRYDIDGQLTQVLLAARELNQEGIPSASWVNRHLTYTHGYGAVLSAANAVTSNGQPELLLKDLPPEGKFEIREPRVYFGENLGGFAIVNTKQGEVDFSGSEGRDQTSRYAGRGGVEMNSLLRRAALALRFGDINPLISDFVTPRSKAIYLRDIRQRVQAAAPFLRYDYDPYPVLIDGRIKWIQDGYTTTSRYPYAQRADTDRLPLASGLQSRFNYVRNPVKVVIDAYDGDMKFYVLDKEEPILRAYRQAFPDLFTELSDEDPAHQELRRHFRYPEDLFRVQTNMFGTYHITNPTGFYHRTDAWDIAQDPGGTVTELAPGAPVGGAQGLPGRPSEDRMDPYYLLMRLPDATEEDFLILQNFVPTSREDRRKELSAFMVAKSDPERYGQLQAFVMPRDRQIDGPAQVNARIDQEPTISREKSLLDQRGSKVREGNLLVLPVGNSLLYIRPWYVQAEQTPLPEFKKVIVVHGDRVVMGNTLREALEAVFGASPPTLEQGAGAPPPPPDPGAGPPPGGPPAGPPPAGAADAERLIQQADAAHTAARQALDRGDLGTYKAKNDEAADLTRRAVEASRARAGPTTTTTSASA